MKMRIIRNFGNLGNFAVCISALAIFVCLLLLVAGCRGGDDGGVAGLSDFSLVSGSGTVTVNVLNASTGGYTDDIFMWGTASNGVFAGNDVEISSDDFSDTLNWGGGGSDIVFIGGQNYEFGGFIDVNGNGGSTHMPDDNDLTFVPAPVLISGNEQIVLTYPTNFYEVTGSGTITVNLLNASGLVDEEFHFGTASTGAPWGGSLTIADDDDSGTILDDAGGVLEFTGGAELIVGGFIDMNGNSDSTHMADDGDWLAYQTITVSGDETLTFDFNTDFTAVTGSGTVSVILENVSDFIGKTFYWGTVTAGSAIGEDLPITGDVVTATLQSEGVDVIFTGGSILDLGGFIDASAPYATDTHMADDGDYLADVTQITINGDMTFLLKY